MSAAVRVSIERKRGCGFRKGGGIYLVSGGMSEPCSALPVPLEVCPVCHSGIHPARGWTWVAPKRLLDLPRGPHPPEEHYSRCPFAQVDGLGLGDKAGLLWIGGVYYKTPADFTAEARELGVSRRIASVPRGFELGQWVLVAHQKAVQYEKREGDEEYGPGVFHAFRPTAIEYVVRGDETQEELEALTKRGMSLVKVVRAGEQASMDQLDELDDAEELES